MATTADAQAAADKITTALQTDPTLGPLLKRQAAGQSFDATAANARLKQLGIELPTGMWLSGGKVQHENMTVDNIGKAVKIGSLLAIGAYGVGALAGGATSGSYIGTAVAHTAAQSSVPIASVGASVAPAVVKAAPSLWSKLVSPAVTTGIQAGTSLIGTKMQVDANKKAADIAAKAAQDALDWEKQQYATRQQQLAPSIGVGNQATVRLGELMGLPTPAGGYQAPAQAPAAPPAAPPAVPTSGPSGAPAAPDGVRMKTPQGRVILVPQAEVAHATQNGAVAA